MVVTIICVILAVALIMGLIKSTFKVAMFGLLAAVAYGIFTGSIQIPGL